MHKFFVSSDAISNSTVVITGTDARHISFSLRMKKGAKICVSSSEGETYLCIIVGFAEGNVFARIESVLQASSESPCRIRLFQALPKGDKLEVIIQKAVECGVYSVTPFESRFCIAKVGDTAKKLERWNRIALEAAKQCGRSVVPKVLPPVSYERAIKEASEDALSLFCYENERSRMLGSVLKQDASDCISIVVGAEGGFSQEEISFAESNGLTVVGLGPRILRCETASGFVLACISLCRELTD